VKKVTKRQYFNWYKEKFGRKCWRIPCWRKS